MEAKCAADPEAVKEFFTAEEMGMAAKMGALIDQLGGAETSLASSRTNSLTTKIEQNQARISMMNERLDNHREQLYIQCYRMEEAIGKMQVDLSIVSALQPVSVASSGGTTISSR